MGRRRLPLAGSGRHGGLWHWDQLRQLAEVLGGGGEVEFIAGTARSS